MDPKHTAPDDLDVAAAFAPIVTVTIGSTVVLSVGPDGTLVRQLPLAETATITAVLAQALALTVSGLAVPLAEMAAANVSQQH